MTTTVCLEGLSVLLSFFYSCVHIMYNVFGGRGGGISQNVYIL